VKRAVGPVLAAPPPYPGKSSSMRAENPLANAFWTGPGCRPVAWGLSRFSPPGQNRAAKGLQLFEACGRPRAGVDVREPVQKRSFFFLPRCAARRSSAARILYPS